MTSVCPQIREAYLQFMITIAKMVREDKNLTKDDNYVQEEMARVMDLESDIAKVKIFQPPFNKWRVPPTVC